MWNGRWKWCQCVQWHKDDQIEIEILYRLAISTLLLFLYSRHLHHLPKVLNLKNIRGTLKIIGTSLVHTWPKTSLLNQWWTIYVPLISQIFIYQILIKKTHMEMTSGKNFACIYCITGAYFDQLSKCNKSWGIFWGYWNWVKCSVKK